VTRRAFRLLPHTADIRIEVRGADFARLCASCVEALFSLQGDRRRIRPVETRILRIAGGPPPEALFALLKEALLLFSDGRFLVRSARGTMEGKGTAVEVRGERIDLSRHSVYREIKAVTAHGLTVESGEGGLLARFIVDV
jgi:SHS2 domain-containing protein